MVPGHQILMGVATAVLCLVGLWRDRWFLDRTAKGQALVRRFGDVGAARVLRTLLVAGVLLGVLLATGVVNPLRWS